MRRSITTIGRVSASLPIEMLVQIKAFAAETKLSQSDALGALIALGLRAHGPMRSGRKAALPPHSFA
jgi:hypothetical protein